MLNMNPSLLTLIVTDLLFEPCNFEFVEPVTFVPMTFSLGQTLTYIKREGLTDFAPTIFPRPFVRYDIVYRPMTHLLANFKYVCLFNAWAQ